MLLNVEIPVTIKLDIVEYKPIGLYFFNNQLFYFSKEGKIIDKYIENKNEKFIKFYGNQSLKKASDFLNNLNNFNELPIIKEAYFIKQRRWDIKLDNEILINLSEKNIAESIKNYIKLIKKFNDSEIISIKSIDLRNNEKAIINFR